MACWRRAFTHFAPIWVNALNSSTPPCLVLLEGQAWCWSAALARVASTPEASQAPARPGVGPSGTGQGGHFRPAVSHCTVLTAHSRRSPDPSRPKGSALLPSTLA
jgi:hypothetical protein